MSNDQSLYEIMNELDRLEELREDLEEAGLRSIEEIEARIEELQRLLDGQPGEDPLDQ